MSEIRMLKLEKSIHLFAKTRGGVKTAAGSEMSQVSGNYHEHKEPVVMVMVSIEVISLCYAHECFVLCDNFVFEQTLLFMRTKYRTHKS